MNDTVNKLTSFVQDEPDRYQNIFGKFHAHLTFNICADQLEACSHFCQQHRVKLTIIELENSHDRSQRDVMTTSHFRDENPGAVFRITRELTKLATS